MKDALHFTFCIMSKAAYVYILTNKYKNVLYTGVTNDLVRRVFEHKNNIKRCFTSKYNVHCLVYYETHQNIHDAIHREKIIKKKSRRGRIILIDKMNPEWVDLSVSVL